MRKHKGQNGLGRSLAESHGSVVHDAGFSFEPIIDIAEDTPNQAQALQGLGTQFDHNNSTLDHFTTTEGEKITNQDPDFIATWLRNKQQVSADREDAKFIPIDQRLRIMTNENIYEELLRAGFHDEDLDMITLALCRRGKDSMQRIFAILCMLGWPFQIKAFMEAEILDRHLPFTFKGGLAYHQNLEDQKQLGAHIQVFQESRWRPHQQDSFDMYQRQICAPFFQLSWTAKDDIFHYSLKDSLVLPFMRVDPPVDDVQDNPFANLITFQGGTSIVHKVKIHPSHHNPDLDTVSGYPKKKCVSY